MRVKNQKYIIGIITSLILVSSISVLVPIVKHYSESFSKNSILLSAASKYSGANLLGNSINQATSSLINNLSYVREYISSSVLQKQKILELSIVGSHYDKSDISSKHYKESELATLNRTSFAKKNRYRKQTIATINNSKKYLNSEDKVISQIIPILKEHPYTYSSYLSLNGLIIPNINFFLNSDESFASNNLNSKTSNISNNKYEINNSSTNLNSVAFSSEENVVSAKALSTAGSSLTKAWFKQVSFNAKIVTFNTHTNSYEYAKATSKDITKDSISSTQLNNNLIGTSNSEIISGSYFKDGDSPYFNLNRNNLSQTDSSFNDSIPNSIINPILSVINPILPNYFNTHLGVIAKATIKYKSVASYTHNMLWYNFGGMLAGTLITAIGYGIYHKVIKNRIKKDKLKLEQINKSIIYTIEQKNDWRTCILIRKHVNEIKSEVDAIIMTTKEGDEANTIVEIDNGLTRLDHIPNILNLGFKTHGQVKDEQMQETIIYTNEIKMYFEEIRGNLQETITNKNKTIVNYGPEEGNNIPDINQTADQTMNHPPTGLSDEVVIPNQDVINSEHQSIQPQSTGTRVDIIPKETNTKIPVVTQFSSRETRKRAGSDPSSIRFQLVPITETGASNTSQIGGNKGELTVVKKRSYSNPIYPKNEVGEAQKPVAKGATTTTPNDVILGDSDTSPILSSMPSLSQSELADFPPLDDRIAENAERNIKINYVYFEVKRTSLEKARTFDELSKRYHIANHQIQRIEHFIKKKGLFEEHKYASKIKRVEYYKTSLIRVKDLAVTRIKGDIKNDTINLCLFKNEYNTLNRKIGFLKTKQDKERTSVLKNQIIKMEQYLVGCSDHPELRGEARLLEDIERAISL